MNEPTKFSPDPGTGRFRILVVDSPDVVKLFSICLGDSKNIDVVFCEPCGELSAAKESLDAAEFDLAVVGLVGPTFGGLGFLREKESSIVASKVPVVVFASSPGMSLETPNHGAVAATFHRDDFEALFSYLNKAASAGSKFPS